MHGGNVSEVIQLDANDFDNVAWDLESENPKSFVLQARASGRSIRGEKIQSNIANVSELGEVTFLQFQTPKHGKGDCSIFDTQGRLVWKQQFDANAGANSIEVDLNSGVQSGVFYYIINTPSYPINGRFLKISR